MRKFLFLIIFFNTISFGNELAVATKILDKISYALIKKDVIKVFTVGKKEKQIIDNSDHMRSADNCHNADLILSNGEDDISSTCKERIIFYTKYKAFKHNPYAIGAFFWQKGRPNIIFRKNILLKYDISLSNEFDKYIE